MRVRIEFDTPEEALEHSRKHGGYVAQIEPGNVFWYDNAYTDEDIDVDQNEEVTFLGVHI